jgi:hypothetical protein
VKSSIKVAFPESIFYCGLAVDRQATSKLDGNSVPPMFLDVGGISFTTATDTWNVG